MAQKPILYLDQPYLSNMAKAKFGLSNSMSMADGKFYNSLYDAIHDAVFSDRLVCAGSDYQLAEASLDDRLEEAIGRVRSDLIGGLSFLDFYTLLTGQVVEDALHNAGWPPNGAAW
ncbi:MAG: hypothetical protein HW403_1403, partial [Dehalococcoidia bacterium]|nr:hypothetical protein [Dehalococcoidia bacterium]